MIQLRVFTPDDYPMVSSWWEAANWPPVPQEALSPLGMVAYSEKEQLAVGWVYMVTQYWAIIEWLVVNPQASMKSRKLAVESRVERLVKEAKGFGAKVIFGYLKAPGLIRLYKRHGFQVTDIGMTHLVYKIGETK